MGHEFPPPQRKEVTSAGTAPAGYQASADIDTSEATGNPKFLWWGFEVVNFDMSNTLFVSFDGTTDYIRVAPGERVVRDHFAGQVNAGAPQGLRAWVKGGVVYSMTVWA